MLLQAHQVIQNKQIKNLWRLAFVTLVWAIWNIRRKAIFEDIRPSLNGGTVMILDLIQEAQHFKLDNMHGMEDFTICRRLRIPGNPKPPKVASVFRWIPPPPGCYKLNVDGSVEDGHIFAGCVVRNSLGFFVVVFSITLGRESLWIRSSWLVCMGWCLPVLEDGIIFGWSLIILWL